MDIFEVVAIMLLASIQAVLGLELGSCTTSQFSNKSCSPSWCVFDHNVACLFAAPTWDYAGDLAALSCKTCTPSSASQCSKAAMNAAFKASYCMKSY